MYISSKTTVLAMPHCINKSKDDKKTLAIFCMHAYNAILMTMQCFTSFKGFNPLHTMTFLTEIDTEKVQVQEIMMHSTIMQKY